MVVVNAIFQQVHNFNAKTQRCREYNLCGLCAFALKKPHDVFHAVEDSLSTNIIKHQRAILRQLCCHLLLFQRCYPCLFRLFKRLLMLDLLNFSFDDMFP